MDKNKKSNHDFKNHKVNTNKQYNAKDYNSTLEKKEQYISNNNRTHGHDKTVESLINRDIYLIKNEQKRSSVIEDTEMATLKNRNKNKDLKYTISGEQSIKNDPHNTEMIKTKSVSDTPRKIGQIGTSGIRVLLRSSYNLTTQNTDIRKPLDNVRDLATVTALPLIDIARNRMVKNIQYSCAKELNLMSLDEASVKRAQAALRGMGKEPLHKSFVTEDEFKQINAFLKNKNQDEVIGFKLRANKKDFTRLEKELVAELRREGLLEKGGAGFSTHNALKVDWLKHINKDKLTDRQLKLVNELEKVSKANSLRPGKHRRSCRLIKRRAIRYLEQSDAGKGLAQMLRFVSHASMILRTSYRNICNIHNITHLATKKAFLEAKKLYVSKLRDKIANSIVDTPLKEVADSLKAVKKTAKSKVDKVKKRTNKIKDLFNKYKQKLSDSMLGRGFKKFRKGYRIVRHPFKSISNRFINSSIYKKMMNNKLIKWLSKKRQAHKAKKAARAERRAKLWAKLIKRIWPLLMILGGAFVLIIVILSVFFLYDFDTYEEEYKVAALEKIQSMQEKEKEKIMNIKTSGDYYIVTGPNYEDVRNDEIYQEHASETLVETTNAAEILSMSIVYYDFDIESATKHEYVEYVRKLYNGSHKFKFVVTKEQYQVQDGDEIIVKERKRGDITVITHYFDSIFDCKLMNSAATIQDGDEIDVLSDLPQIWTCTGYDRWLDTGNTMRWAPGTNQKLVADDWHSTGEQFSGGIATIDGRFLVAVTDTFGTVGDYIDVYFEDGTCIPCRIADAKSRGDSNWSDYGHIAYDSAGNEYLSVIEFEVEYSAYHGHGGNPGSNGWEPFIESGYQTQLNGGRVTKIVNGGPNPPETDVGKGKKIVKAAKNCLGVKYLPDGNSTDGFDQAGLVHYCYDKAGIEIPSTASEIISQGSSISNPQPGDIVYGGYNMGIYIGNGQIIWAPGMHQTVCIASIPSYMDSYLRYK